MAAEAWVHGGALLLWTAWCVLHSVLAADGPSAALRSRLGLSEGAWRMSYNAVAVASLVPPYAVTVLASSPEVWVWSGWWRLPQGALLAGGTGLLVAGARRYDLRQFLGLAPGGRGGIAAGGRLETSGILGVVRHPWYLAGLLLVWARDLRALDVLVSALLSCYLVVGAHLEERRLLRRFGEAYRGYRRRVPMLVPRPGGGRRRGGRPRSDAKGGA